MAYLRGEEEHTVPVQGVNMSDSRERESELLAERENLRRRMAESEKSEAERKRLEGALFRTNRALRAFTECNQLMVRVGDEPEFLRETCRIIVETGGYRLAWIGYAEKDKEKTVRPAAQWGYEEGYLDTLNITWAETKRGQGPTGTSIRTRAPAVAQHILTDPEFEPWRKEALKRGYESSLALPLLAGESVLGALNIYSGEPEAFEPAEIQLLSEVAAILTYGIMSIRSRVDRMKAEEALRESEEKYRLHFENVGDVIYSTDDDFRIRSVSPSVETILGYKPEEITGRRIDELRLLDPEYHDRAISNTKRILAGERITPTEYVFIAKDGTRKTAEIIGAPLVKDGKIAAVVSVARDITARRLAEEELRRYRNHLEQVVEERAEKLMAVNEQLQREIAERKQAEKALRDALEGSRKRGLETSALLEGSRAVLEMRDFKTAAENVFHACKRLIGASAGYVALLSADGEENEVLFLDSGGLPCTVDPSLPMPIRGLRAKAYSIGQAVYDNEFDTSEWRQFLPVGHAPLHNVLFAPLLFQAKAVGIMGLANKPGGFTDGDARLAAAFADHAAIALQNSRNLEALRESEARYRLLSQNLDKEVKNKVAELRQAESMAAIGRMVSTVAHEVRNPLQNIQMGVDMVRKKIGEGKENVQILEGVDYGISLLNKIVSELLDYARPVNPDYSSLPIGIMVRQALKTLAHKLGSIETSVEVEQEEREITVDPVKFTQALVNLMSNAAEAMPQGGTLRICSQFRNVDGASVLRLSISDTGHGIEEDDLEQIQQPFFTTKPRGVGLGIPVCKKIIEAHDGSLSFTSTIGMGTTAEISIPVGNV